MAQQRQTATDQNLCAALVRLLAQHSVDELTVSMITREAGVNRATFYAHYKDKASFIDAQVEEFISRISQIILSQEDMPPAVTARDLIPYSRVLDALRYVSENRDIAAALVNADTSGVLKERFEGVLWQLVLQEVSRAPELAPTFKSVPEEYAREIALAGITSVVWKWVSDGCGESPEEIARIIDIAKIYPPYELLQ